MIRHRSLFHHSVCFSSIATRKAQTTMRFFLSRLNFPAHSSRLKKLGLSYTPKVMFLSGLVLAAVAEESHGLQFRLTMGMAPGITTLSTTDSANADGSSNYLNDGDDFITPKFGFTFEPGFVYSFAEGKSWGLMVGSSFFYRSVHGAANYAGGSDVKVTLDSLGFDVSGGVYWQPDRWWRVEATPVFGYGRGKTTIKVSSPFGTDNDSTAYSPYTDYGFRVGTYYRLPNYVLLGLQVGYQAFSTSPASLTLANGSTEKDKVSGAGMVTALSFVLVF